MTKFHYINQRLIVINSKSSTPAVLKLVCNDGVTTVFMFNDKIEYTFIKHKIKFIDVKFPNN